MTPNLFDIYLRILQKRNSGVPLETWESQTLRSLVEDERMPVFPSREFPPKYFPQAQRPKSSQRITNPQGTIYSRSLARIKQLGELSQYEDVVPRSSGESDSAYSARIQNNLLQRLKMSFRNLDKKTLEGIRYNAHPGEDIFQKAGSGNNYVTSQAGKLTYGKPREFVTLDIETDDWGNPITISALKQVFNKATGKFETLDSYQRFYNARNRDLVATYDTHHLTHAALKKLRSQQGSRYSASYDQKEETLLKEFLGSSIIVGHNIVDYDLRKLFKGYDIGNQTIDTLIAARNIWKDQPNGLADVFKRLFGMTMEQAGLPHHDSMSDTIATVMVAQELMVMKNTTGKTMRYIATHPNYHLAPYDSMLNSQISRGTYSRIENLENRLAKGDIRDMGYLFDDSDDLDALSDKIGTGMHEETFLGTKDTPGLGIDAGLMYSLTDTMKHLETVAKANKSAADELRQTYGIRDAYAATNLRKYVAGFSTEKDMRRYLQHTGWSGDIQDAIVADALELQKVLPDRQALGASSRARKLGWQALRAGHDDFAQRFSDVLKSGNIYDIWEAEEDYKDYLQRQKTEASDIAKRDKAQDAFLSRRQDIFDKYVRYGYAEDELQDIAKARDEDALKDALDEFKFVQRQRKETMAAIKSGDYEKATAVSRTETQLELDNLNDSFGKTTTYLGAFGNALLNVAAQLNNLPVESYQNVLRMQQSQASGVLGAANSVIPGFFLKPMSRFANAYMNFARSGYAKTQFAWDTMHYAQKAAPIVGSVVGGAIGTALGGPIGTGVGAGLGGTIGTAVSGVGNLVESSATYFQNKWREKQLTQYGEAIQGRLNLLGGYAEIVAAPFRILAKAAHLLSRNFLNLNNMLLKTLRGGMDAYNNMGSPLTPLTGVGYGGFENTSYIDILTNARRGTTNSVYESFAQAQQDLYWGGRFDQGRMTAAALLGVYGDVYANGGDTRAQYAHMVNTLFGNMKNSPSQRQFILGQSSRIDSQLPQILSYMERAERYLGRSVSYESLQNAGTWGVYKRDLSEAEADRFYGYRMERGVIKGSFENTKMRFAGLMWNSFGRDILDGLNKAMDRVYQGFESSRFLVGMRELAEDIKNQRWDEIWGDIKNVFAGGMEDLKDIFSGIDFHLDLSGLKNTITKGLTFVNDAWWALLAGMTKSLSGLIDYVNTININPKELMKALKGKEHRSILSMGYDQAVEYSRGTYEGVKGYSWFGNVVYGGVSKNPDAQQLLYGMYGSDISILGQSIPRESFRTGNANILKGFSGAKVSALQKFMDVASSNEWSDPYKAVGWLTSLEGRDTYETLFNAEQRAAIEEMYKPKWLDVTLATLEQLKAETDLNLGNIVDKLIGALTGMELKVNIDNKVELVAEGDVKKVADNKAVIPNLLSFTINGKSTAGYAGNLVQKLTAASTGGR